MFNLKNVRTKSRRLGTTSHKKPSLNICIRSIIFIHCAFVFVSNEKSIISRLNFVLQKELAATSNIVRWMYYAKVPDPLL